MEVGDRHALVVVIAGRSEGGCSCCSFVVRAVVGIGVGWAAGLVPVGSGGLCIRWPVVLFLVAHGSVGPGMAGEGVVVVLAPHSFVWS